MERWMLVPNKNDYAVSDYGRIMNVRSQRVLVQTLTHNGYCSVTLGYNNTFRVHRLVALVFVENPNTYPYVNHLDGCKTNNVATNLEWCTAYQNDLHARLTGLKGSSGTPNDNRPVVITHVETGKQFVFVSTAECSRFLDTNNGSVHRVLKGIRTMHKGFYIQYR